MSRVSVLLTSYNHQKYLAESIDSILEQTFKDFELYIVDDCSTDESWTIIQQYTDERIHAVRMDKNTNCSYFDEYVMKMTGEYIAIAHCDDKWKVDKLEKQVFYLDNHPQKSACFTAVEVIDEDGNEITGDDIYYKAFHKQYKDRYEWIHSLLFEGCGLCHPSLLIRGDAYSKYSLCGYGFDSIPDYRKWIRLCIMSDIYVIPEPLTSFRSRKNGDNTSGDRPEKHFRNMSEMFWVLNEFLELQDSKDFVKAFPETEQYVVNNELIIPFAFSKMLLDKMNQSVFHLFALTTIWKLLQVQEIREKIETLYGYSLKSFNKDKLKYDIFGAVSNEQFFHARAYADIGNGYSENLCVQIKDIYIDSNYQFHFGFEFGQMKKSDRIKQIRLDLGVADYMQFKDVVFFESGKQCEQIDLTPHIEKDGWQSFITPFPNYEFKIKENSNKFECFGRAKHVSNWEVESLINGELVTEEMLQTAFLWYSEKCSMNKKVLVKKIMKKLIGRNKK